MDFEASSTCPQGIADHKPCIVIVDNDDLKIDTLTGSAKDARRTSSSLVVMFLQPKSYEIEGVEEQTEQPAKFKKKELFVLLQQKFKELTHLKQYRCPLIATVSHQLAPWSDSK